MPYGANKNSIKKAYYKLAKKHHPDICNGSHSKQKFIEKELKEIQKKIAIDHQNASKAQMKAKEIRKKEAIVNENRRDLLTPKINKI